MTDARKKPLSKAAAKKAQEQKKQAKKFARQEPRVINPESMKTNIRPVYVP